MKLTNMAQLTEEVGEVWLVFICSQVFGEQSEKNSEDKATRSRRRNWQMFVFVVVVFGKPTE